MPETTSCTDVVFIGLRGSGEAPKDGNSDINPGGYTPDGENALGSNVWGAYQGFEQRIHAVDPAMTIKMVGIKYTALGVPHNPFGDGGAPYINSIYDGVDKLQERVRVEHRDCPDAKFVLAGYSQGALAIHIALRYWDQYDNPVADQTVLLGVVLVADPAKTSNRGNTLWEGAFLNAGDGVKNAEGVWTKTLGPASAIVSNLDVGPLPNQDVARTIEICHNHDLVCAPGLGKALLGVGGAAYRIKEGITQHTNYDETETKPMGTWAAEKVLTYFGL